MHFTEQGWHLFCCIDSLYPYTTTTVVFQMQKGKITVGTQLETAILDYK